MPLPDAEAAFAILASSGLGWVLARDRPARWRIPVVTAVVLWIVLGGFARLYVGDTWLSGLLGGWSLAAWFALLAGAYAYWRIREHVQPRGARRGDGGARDGRRMDGSRAMAARPRGARMSATWSR